jgi:tetratricopeptide (TPR) repeat protein
MSAKIISVRCAVGLLAALLLLDGCSPSGSRAMSRGKKYLDEGDNAAAVEQFKTATTLFATNAGAWNYYGVALQRAGSPNDAANAYRRALELDRELLEARLNLGTLCMEQGQPDAAKAEFTAYTLRRPNDATGWLKLGSAQLRLGEVVAAERSFSAAHSLNTNDPAAYNGLGLARVQRGRPQEGAKFFAAALETDKNFAPAILNLATVSQQYLHDNKTAREYFQKYLALTPRPANWNDVKAVADSLEEPVVAANTQPTAAATTTAPPVTQTPKPTAPVAVAQAEPKPEAKPTAKPTNSPVRLAQSPRAIAERPSVAVVAVPPQVVQVAPEQPLVTSQNSTPLEHPASSTTVVAAPPNVNASKKPAPVILPPSPVNFPRYQYLSPARPAAGDRKAASAVFAQAQDAERNQKPADALPFYRQAAALDPSWFAAQYNAGVLAYRLQSYSTALSSFELALATAPDKPEDAVSARYLFALTLKLANYVPDAENELKKILAANPDEVRAHLALANLCAGELRDPVQAREHYRKVLELEPNHPQAANIRSWLGGNPQ